LSDADLITSRPPREPARIISESGARSSTHILSREGCQAAIDEKNRTTSAGRRLIPNSASPDAGATAWS
jgi:hypothetical protein